MYALRKVLYILIVQMDLPTFIQNQKESILAQKNYYVHLLLCIFGILLECGKIKIDNKAFLTQIEVFP